MAEDHGISHAHSHCSRKMEVPGEIPRGLLVHSLAFLDLILTHHRVRQLTGISKTTTPHPAYPEIISGILLAITDALIIQHLAFRSIRIQWHLQVLLSRLVHGKPVHPGKDTSGDRQADDEQYQPGKRRSSGLLV